MKTEENKEEGGNGNGRERRKGLRKVDPKLIKRKMLLPQEGHSLVKDGFNCIAHPF